MTAVRGGFVALRVALVAAASIVFVRPPCVPAMSTGIIGYSGKQGTTCNDDCHIGGVAPLVRFEGPQQVMADAIATFRFVVTSQASRQKVAGFNVAAGDGTLGVVVDQAEHLEVDELTHDAPKSNVDGVADWQFTWHVPSQQGIYTLYGAGLSANGNGTDGGDDSNFTTLEVTVTVGPPGDANCDTRVSAVDVTAVVERLTDGTPGSCIGADVDANGVVDTRDVAAAVAAVFGG